MEKMTDFLFDEAEAIAEVINKKGGYTATVQRVCKNNVELPGIIIRLGTEKISPCLYHHELLRNTGFMTPDEAAEYLLEQYSKAMDEMPKQEACKAIEIVNDFDEIRNKINCYVVGTNNNERFLKERPHRQVADGIALVYEVLATENSAIPITEEFAEKLEMSEDDLYKVSFKRAMESLTYCPIMDVLSKMIDEDMGLSIEEGPKMIVCSNVSKVKGAIAMLGEFESDGYIIPSSIHEVLFIPEERSEETTLNLNQMVEEVNATQVALCDRLADCVYYYSRKDGLMKA